MTRTNATARKAGSEFEGRVAAYLAEALGDDRIERRARRGSKDAGDIAGVRIPEGRVVVECKDYIKPRPWVALREAEAERMNDGAALGVVVMKVPLVGWAHMDWQCTAVRREDFDRLFYGERAYPIGALHVEALRDVMRCGPKYAEVVSGGRDRQRAVLMTLRTFAAYLAGGEEFLNEEKKDEDRG